MNSSFHKIVSWLITIAFLFQSTSFAQPLAKAAWKLDEALAQLELYPQDSYLQYVALQLARRENRTDEIAAKLEKTIFGATTSQDRRNSIDLYSIFTGALAVQESLQLDTMRGERPGSFATATPTTAESTEPPPPPRPTPTKRSTKGAKLIRVSGGVLQGSAIRKVQPTYPPIAKAARAQGAVQVQVVISEKGNVIGAKAVSGHPLLKDVSVSAARQWKFKPTEFQDKPVKVQGILTFNYTLTDDDDKPVPANEPSPALDKAALEQRRKEIVAITSLTGPTIQGHPWEKMLAGRKPDISPLAHFVPEDFYFVEFRSLNKLLEAAETSDLWGTHFLNQSYREARTHNFADRIKQQLAIETSALARPFYDAVVEDIAITGSDLFVREGSDVSLIFRLKQPEVFKTQMDGYLNKAARVDVKRTTGNYLGVDYVQLASPERDISVVSAYPKPNVHVRANSLAAFKRIIEAMNGQAKALGATTEMAYIRTLMPRGANEEDGFVYLSDPFIRRLVGPQLKITERRRMLCYNHLRMIGHASLLYQTEQGKKPDSIATLAKDNCSPGTFGEGILTCPSGGKYALSADGNTGVCSHHGQAQFLTPNIEIPVTQANGEEADEYKRFLDDYNQYWRMYFDPIALRLKLTDKQYRLETIVLPLIDNSIYTGMATVFGGKPEPLDALPVPKRNIFSIGLRLNKEKLLEELEKSGLTSQAESLTKDLGVDIDKKAQADFMELLTHGIGNQIGLHLYDAAPMFDLNFPALMGMVLASSTRSGRNSGFGDYMGLAIGFGVALLNTPVYASIPVKDAQRVDEFIKFYESTAAASARKLQRGSAFFGIETDYFGYPIASEKSADAPMIQAFALRFGPVKFRIFASRIGNAFYIASKPFILEDLYALEKSGVKGNTDAVGHAMVRLRPNNWKEILPDYRLGWAENQREACLNNLGVLSSTGRAFLAQSQTAAPGEATGRAIHQYANKMHAVQFFCPEGGKYQLAADNKTIKCSIHGDALTPRQPAAPLRDSSLDKLMNSFAGATATLEFTEDGLRAVVTIDRK